MKEKELSIVTEVGVFGELNIEDPTEKKIKKKSDLEETISKCIEENLNKLSND